MNVGHRLSRPAAASAPVGLKSTLSEIDFYRAMHFSAKRGIAIACRLSVCPSVRL